MSTISKGHSKKFKDRLKDRIKTEYPKLFNILRRAKLINWRFLSEQWDFRWHRLKNKPYFGPVLTARQGLPRRHGYMQRLVQLECQTLKNEPYRILEIGSWAGGSAITWAEAIKKFNGGKGVVACVDAWKDYIDVEKNRGVFHYRMAKAAKKNRIFDLFTYNIKAAGHDDVVFLFKGFSEEILPLLGNEKFNLIFVDGAHTYREVLRDLRASAPLVVEGGILCGDDLALQTHQIDLENAERNKLDVEYMRDPKANRWFHPGVTLAVAEFFGEASVWEGFWAMRKCGSRWEKIGYQNADFGQVSIPRHLLRS